MTGSDLSALTSFMARSMRPLTPLFVLLSFVPALAQTSGSSDAPDKTFDTTDLVMEYSPPPARNPIYLDGCLSAGGWKCPGLKAAELFCREKGFNGLASANLTGSPGWTKRIDPPVVYCQDIGGRCGTYRDVTCTNNTAKMMHPD